MKYKLFYDQENFCWAVVNSDYGTHGYCEFYWGSHDLQDAIAYCADLNNNYY